MGSERSPKEPKVRQADVAVPRGHLDRRCRAGAGDPGIGEADEQLVGAAAGRRDPGGAAGGDGEDVDLAAQSPAQAVEAARPGGSTADVPGGHGKPLDCYQPVREYLLPLHEAIPRRRRSDVETARVRPRHADTLPILRCSDARAAAAEGDGKRAE